MTSICGTVLARLQHRNTIIRSKNVKRFSLEFHNKINQSENLNFIDFKLKNEMFMLDRSKNYLLEVMPKSVKMKFHFCRELWEPFVSFSLTLWKCDDNPFKKIAGILEYISI